MAVPNRQPRLRLQADGFYPPCSSIFNTTANLIWFTSNGPLDDRGRQATAAASAQAGIGSRGASAALRADRPGRGHGRGRRGGGRGGRRHDASSGRGWRDRGGAGRRRGNLLVLV